MLVKHSNFVTLLFSTYELVLPFRITKSHKQEYQDPICIFLHALPFQSYAWTIIFVYANLLVPYNLHT